MKKICILAALSAIASFAHSFEVDGIYYDITSSSEPYTVAITYKGDTEYQYKNEYSGSVVIPSSVNYDDKTYAVTSIGYGAFSGCKGLTSMTIPKSVTSIGSSAFYGCSGLASIEIPNSVTEIGDSAFSGCSGLTSVTIPNSVTSIGKYAFSGCSGLTSVTIPNSVTSIGGRSFYKCSGLTSITIPNTVTSIGHNAFSGTAWWDNQPEGVVYIGNILYEYKGTMPENTSIIIKEGCTGIAGKAFYGCSGLTNVTIPNAVTSIGSYAFSGTMGHKMKSTTCGLVVIARSACKHWLCGDFLLRC